MRIGVVSDPHGCLVGLRTSLDWLQAEGVDAIVCAGDVANFGPQPNECISLLAELDIPAVQGNTDRDILLPSPASPPSDGRGAQIAAINDWGRAALGSASREWLAALPARLSPATGLLIVHGGLGGPDEIVGAEARPKFPPEVSVVAAGHLHAPFINDTGQGLWVNAGSVGRPCDGDPRAALAILELRPKGWTASIHRIPFDLDAAAQAIHKAGMPYAGRLMETQRLAHWW